MRKELEERLQKRLNLELPPLSPEQMKWLQEQLQDMPAPNPEQMKRLQELNMQAPLNLEQMKRLWQKHEQRLWQQHEQEQVRLQLQEQEQELSMAQRLMHKFFSKFPRYKFRETRITKPPGSSLLSLIEKIASKKAHQNIFEPLVADWQEEYFEALHQKRGRAKLFFINTRYRWAFAKACGLSAVMKFVAGAIKFMVGS